MADGRRSVRRVWLAALVTAGVLLAGAGALSYIGTRGGGKAPPGEGLVACSSRTIAGARFRVCEVAPPGVPRLELFVRDPAGRPLATIARVDSLVARRGGRLAFATNGGIFERPDSATGLLVSEGRELSAIDTTTPASDCPDNFRCLPNAVFYATRDGRAGVLATGDFVRARAALSLRFATQSGPMLVRGGALARPFNPASSSTKLRSGVGVRADGTIVFAITDDRVTPFAFAAAFRDALRAANAMFLDGEISQLYTGGGSAAPDGGPFASIIALTVPDSGRAR